MPIHGHPPKSIATDQIIANARAALAGVDVPPGCDIGGVRPAPPSLVSHWPAWVAKAGALAGRGVYCLWCQPLADPRETFPSQLILNVPKGQYVVDVLDVSRAAWTVQETVAGGPLVAGLPYTAGPLLVWIRAVDQPAAAVPADLSLNGSAPTV